MVIFHSYVKLPEGIMYPFLISNQYQRFLKLLRSQTDSWTPSEDCCVGLMLISEVLRWFGGTDFCLIFLPALSHDSSGIELRSLYKVWESAFSSAQTPKVMPDPIASTTCCPSKSCMSHIDTHSMFWWEVEHTNHNKSLLLFLYQKVNL